MENQKSSTQTSPDSHEAFINNLPKATFWDSMEIRKWEGFWLEPGVIKGGLIFQEKFQAQNGDVLLASFMKTGTTWLKALCLTIMHNNGGSEEDEDILVKDNPHFQVHTVEFSEFFTKPAPDLYSNSISSPPRLLHTHLPYTVLPSSIKDSSSGCKIVYIARDPKDTLISIWHFCNTIYSQNNQEPYPLEKAVECFCSGVQHYGPFYEHVLEYWLESKKRPDEILFLKYEDLHKDPKGEVKKLALFLGRPFSDDEDEVVDEVLWRCSLERMKNLDVNKNGSGLEFVPNSSYFRRGVVGDWENYLTDEMVEVIDRTTRLKFEGSGLDFN